MPIISDNESTLSLLLNRAEQSGDIIFATFNEQQLTVADLKAQVEKTATSLFATGIKKGDRVAVMLDNHLDYVVLFFALVWVGAIHVPVNTRLRHDSLSYLILHSDPKLIIAENNYLEHLKSVDDLDRNTQFIIRSLNSGFEWESMINAAQATPIQSHSDDVLFIMYTSGTTGPPKGVMVTDKMLRASAFASRKTSDAKQGDVFMVWEPLYHIGAVQLLPLALEVGVTLAFVGQFRASQFWQQTRDVGATQIHFLGGILQILLRQPANPLDTQHGYRIAWGGGAPLDVACEFESRFNIQVRENYGMTEASSLTSINHDGHKGSVGKPAPYFEVRIVDDQDQSLETGKRGEITVRELESGLITPGYFRNKEATNSTIRGGWLHTGDLGYLDEAGYLYYTGRLKESIRRRGENISAWEIERVVERLACVEQAAAIGVPDELGDEEIKLFVKLTEGSLPSESVEHIFDWCNQRLPSFQVPRYLAFIDEFPKTGTQRIRKELLSRSVDDCVTLTDD